jgi:hypothetical protein
MIIRHEALAALPWVAGTSFAPHQRNEVPNLSKSLVVGMEH